MQTFPTVSLFCLLMVTQGCVTHTKCKREQYAIQYAEAFFALRALSALDTDDIAKAHQTEMSSLSICLAQLHELSGPADLDETDLRLRQQLAKKVLDYATANRVQLAKDDNSLRMISNLEVLLTEPADISRVADLRNHLNPHREVTKP